jgi:hypothetical protein
VNHDDIGFFGDQRGDRLCAGVGIPVGIADVKSDAERLQRLLEAGGPAFGQVEAHRHGHIGNALACEGVVVWRARRIVDALLCAG